MKANGKILYNYMKHKRCQECVLLHPPWFHGLQLRVQLQVYEMICKVFHQICIQISIRTDVILLPIGKCEPFSCFHAMQKPLKEM